MQIVDSIDLFWFCPYFISHSVHVRKTGGQPVETPLLNNSSKTKQRRNETKSVGQIVNNNELKGRDFGLKMDRVAKQFRHTHTQDERLKKKRNCTRINTRERGKRKEDQTRNRVDKRETLAHAQPLRKKNHFLKEKTQQRFITHTNTSVVLSVFPFLIRGQEINLNRYQKHRRQTELKRGWGQII